MPSALFVAKLANTNGSKYLNLPSQLYHKTAPLHKSAVKCHI